jgi:phosphoribosyl 1,2-cyclic phosphate phosphodiesterase
MKNMQVTILGSGASSGVPLVGCACPVCTSENPKNKRSRVSCLIETQGKRLLIDTSPDLRMQCLQNRIPTVDAILYTHAHADHLHGIDDVRMLNYNGSAPIPAYMDALTYEGINERFGYVFQPPIPEYGWFRPCLIPQQIAAYEAFEAAGITVHPFAQNHGRIQSLGFRIGDVAYSTDVKDFPAESERYLEGLQLWIVDCLRIEPAHTHAHLELTLSWIAKYRPERAILTHLSHDFDYEALKAALPQGVEPAYDGLTIVL